MPTLPTGSKLGDAITIKKVVGSGAYGVVYCGFDSSLNKSVAIKALPKRFQSFSKTIRPVSLKNIGMSYLTTRDKVYREVALHLRVHHHPNIVTIHRVFDSNDYLYVVMDYFPRGDLFHAITDLKWYNNREQLVKKVFRQLTNAVQFCHANSIYHCDLKPENILVNDDGSQVFIADFGLATTKQHSTEFGCGSSFYMSPERFVVNNRPVSAEFSASLSDSWALGIILLNLTSGRNPWKKAALFEDRSFRAFCYDRTFLLRIMPNVSLQLTNVLNGVFDPNPSKRLTLTQFTNLVMSTPLTTAEAEAELATTVATCPPHLTALPSPAASPALSSTVASPIIAPQSPPSALLPAFEFKAGTPPVLHAKPSSPKKRTREEADDNKPTTNFGLLSPSITPVLHQQPVFKRPRLQTPLV